MRGRSVRRIFVLSFILSALGAAAQQSPPTPPAPIATPSDAEASEHAKPKLDETIVVTATRSERAVSEVPVSTTVIGEKELKAAPAVFIDDVLRTIPGVHMPLQGSAGSFTSGQRISMHGLGGVRALVLLDGLPIHDPYYGTVQWQKVPLDTLGQVEVVRGGGSSLFGNFALGGTINLLTRPVTESVVRADVSTGSASTQRGSVSLDHVVNERLGFRVSHDRYDSDGFYRVPNPGAADTLGWNDLATTSARVEYRPSDRTSTFVKTNFSRINVSQGTASSYSKRDIFDLSAGMHRAVGAGGLLSTTVFYQDQEETLASSTIVGANRESEFRSQLSTIPADAIGASVEWSGGLTRAIPFVSVGVDVQRIEAEEDRLNFNRSGVMTQQGHVTGSQQFAGVFGQASWRPSTRFEILASARLDYFKNFDGSDVTVNGAASYYPSASSTQLDPRVSFRYAIGERSAIRGAAYRAFKAPTLRDLYRNNQTGTSILLGNPYLEPETLVGAELGVEWALSRAHVEVNVYRSDIDGLQSRAQVPGQPSNVFRNLNLGKSKSQGIELMADARLSTAWSVNAGYTYADSTVIEDPSPALVGKWLPEVPRHIGSLSIRYRSAGGTTADLRGRVVGRSYGEAANLLPSQAHRIVDLSLAQPLRDWIDAYAILENLLNEEYYLVLTPTSLRSGQPRTVSAGLRLRVPTSKAAWRNHG